MNSIQLQSSPVTIESDSDNSVKSPNRFSSSPCLSSSDDQNASLSKEKRSRSRSGESTDEELGWWRSRFESQEISDDSDNDSDRPKEHVEKDTVGQKRLLSSSSSNSSFEARALTEDERKEIFTDPVRKWKKKQRISSTFNIIAYLNSSKCLVNYKLM